MKYIFLIIILFIILFKSLNIIEQFSITEAENVVWDEAHIKKLLLKALVQDESRNLRRRWTSQWQTQNNYL